MRGKQTILIELTSRYLTDGEADEVRAFVVTLKPKVHLVMANWPWIEVRGISEAAATELAGRVQNIAPCKVAINGVRVHQQASRKARSSTSTLGSEQAAFI